MLTKIEIYHISVYGGEVMKGNKKPKPIKTKDESMVRREYYIRRDHDEWLKNQSEQLNKPAAEILREVLDQVIKMKAA